ncbi:PTS sugar transporter subunit IIA [Enterococcus faecalis]
MENLTNISIELNQQFNTKEEAIRFCGEKLVEAGCVEPAYIEAMIERDQLLSVATVLFGIAGVGEEHLQLVQQIALYCSDMDNVVQLADALSKEEITENLAIA